VSQSSIAVVCSSGSCNRHSDFAYFGSLAVPATCVRSFQCSWSGVAGFEWSARAAARRFVVRGRRFAIVIALAARRDRPTDKLTVQEVIEAHRPPPWQQSSIFVSQLDAEHHQPTYLGLLRSAAGSASWRVCRCSTSSDMVTTWDWQKAVLELQTIGPRVTLYTYPATSIVVTEMKILIPHFRRAGILPAKLSTSPIGLPML